jgi:outer membrane protein assembly factor BamB
MQYFLLNRRLVVVFLLSSLCFFPPIAADQPQWGQRHTRNMVSDQTHLPDGFDPQTGRNVKWAVELGTACYSTPVVSGGRVLIGTNNNRPRDPKHQGDRGVLMCLDEADGSLIWQMVVPKLDWDVYLDWPQSGMCSTATVEGDRVYMVTNRAEVVCLDLHGMHNGNDGPFLDEGRHMTPEGQPPLEPGSMDADILWLLDLRAEAGVRPHDSSHASILLDGPYLYVNTSNGLTSKHDGVERPEAPSLVVIDKATGKMLAREREGISAGIFHCTWSSPALGVVDGRRLIFFAGGDGVVYAFDAYQPDQVLPADPQMLNPSGNPDREPLVDDWVPALRCVWRFDCDPTAPKEDIHRYIRNRQVSPSNIKSIPVFHDGRLYVTVGGDIWWGKRQAWLQCIATSGTGDITGTGLVWAYEMDRHCCSTPAIHEGLAYFGDCAGRVHCVDIHTGQSVWVHDAGDEIWASPLVADGKVYIGTRRGTFWVLAAGRDPQVISSIRLSDGIYSTAVAANGTLYVATMSTLYALQSEGAGEPEGGRVE